MGKLPAILCLHGSGVNAKVFDFQTAALQRMLSKTFDFVFLSGPFERSAGDGVLPFFEGSEPFFRWKDSTDDISFTHEDIEPQTAKLIKDTLKTRDDWVGILGFSQGGRLAAGLLAEQERDADPEDDYGDESGFEFGVFFCTPCPPMTTMTWEAGGGPKIKTPSVTIVGKQDPWYESSVEMHKEYFGPKAKLMEYKNGHRLPAQKVELKAVALEMLRLYKMTTGDEGVLS